MAYLLRRFLQMLVILSILSVTLFGLLSLMPGNPIDLLITSNPSIRPQDVARLKKLRGLDQPWLIQYARWIWGYNDPAKPVEIENIPKIQVNGQEQVTIDISKYLYDPNYFPDAALAQKWLLEVWPDVTQESIYDTFISLAKKEDWSEFLFLLGKKDPIFQDEFLEKVKKKSIEFIKITGLFSTKSQGFWLEKNTIEDNNDLWFIATNSFGQDKIGHIELEKNIEENQPNAFILPIEEQLVQDESKPFLLDLKKYAQKKVTFELSPHSVGKINTDGIYSHQFSKDGYSAILLTATDEDNKKSNFAFNIEHGIIKNPKKFNYGFLFFFFGDKDALGFSQTYKRPVYDLLFGRQIICGDHRADPGEMCDDGNTKNNDGCSDKCFLEDKTILEKADTSVAGYIVRSGRIGNTIQLMLPAILLSLLVAIPLGIFSAYRQYSLLDYLINFLAFVGISLPVFWFGIMMIYLFSEMLNLLPAGGVQTPGIYTQGTWYVLLDRLKYAILPTMVLSVFYIGRWLRYMRASMLEILPKDFIRTARAKGLCESVVIFKHAFRNALIPVITILALSIPTLFGGAVLTETVFSWPGIGRLQYDAVINNDYYVAIVVFLVEAILVMVGNFLADIVYIIVDPRMRKR